MDKSHKFIKGKEYSVCGNTFRILKESRFNKHFDFSAHFDVHYGIMRNCGMGMPFNSLDNKCCNKKKTKESKYDYGSGYYPEEYYYGYEPMNYGNYYNYNYNYQNYEY